MEKIYLGNETKTDLHKWFKEEALMAVNDLMLNEVFETSCLDMFEVKIEEDKVVLYSSVTFKNEELTPEMYIPKTVFNLEGKSPIEVEPEIREEFFNLVYLNLCLVEEFFTNYKEEYSKLISKYSSHVPIIWDKILKSNFSTLNQKVRLKLNTRGEINVMFNHVKSVSTIDKLVYRDQVLFNENIAKASEEDIDIRLEKFIQRELNNINGVLLNAVINLLDDLAEEYNYTEEGFKTIIDTKHFFKVKLKSMSTVTNSFIFLSVGAFAKYTLITNPVYYKTFKLKYVTLYLKFKENKLPLILGMYNRFQIDYTTKTVGVDYGSKKLAMDISQEEIEKLQKDIYYSVKSAIVFSSHIKDFKKNPQSKFVSTYREKLTYLNEDSEEVTYYKLNLVNQFKPVIVDNHIFKENLFFDADFKFIPNFAYEKLIENKKLVSTVPVDMFGGNI